MVLIRYLLIIFLFTLSNVSYGKLECGPGKRLDVQGGSLDGVKTIDQGDLGICYAAAGSLMAAANYNAKVLKSIFKEVDDDRVKGFCPLGMAVSTYMVKGHGSLKYNIESAIGNSLVESGNICDTVNSASSVGLCIDCRDFLKGLNKEVSSAERKKYLLALEKRLFRLIKKLSDDGQLGSFYQSEIGMKKAEELYIKFNRQLCGDLGFLGIAFSGYKNLESFRSTLVRLNPMLYMKDIIQNNCHGGGDIESDYISKCNSLYSPNKSEFKKQLRNSFDNKLDMPIGIEYCSDFLGLERPEQFKSIYYNELTYTNEIFQGSVFNRSVYLKEQYNHHVVGFLNWYSSKIRKKSIQRNYRKIIECMKNRASEISQFRNYVITEKKDYGKVSGNTFYLKWSNDFKKCQRKLGQTIPLENKRYAGHQQNIEDEVEKLDILGEQERACSGHASVIMGKRTCKDSKGKVVFQYLLKNSWGSECLNYNFSSKYSNAECEEGKGNIWLDEKTILNNTIRVSTFDNKTALF